MIPSNIGKSPENAVTPSTLNRLAKNAIENQLASLWLTGEVTDLYQAPSGHAYFSLKDQKSSIKCTFFKQYNFKKILIQNGDNLLVLGLATLYEERGTFQLKVERVEQSGIGDLAKAFAELKIKLENLGYFSPDKKKKLPAIINSLAIITSKSSAAIRDVLNVIKRRNPLLQIKIYHASVQGEKAIEEIIDALLTADINQHDVILLTRGGGSDEDLWTFNDVSIAQTLFNLETPSVSAVGHEKDTSISDLVADASAITPSAAAEMLTPDLSHIKTTINHNLNSLKHSIINKINHLQQKIDSNHHMLHRSHPKNSIDQQKQKMHHYHQKLIQNIQWHNHQKKQEFIKLKQNLLHYGFDINAKKSVIGLNQNRLINAVNKQFEHSVFHVHNSADKLNTLSPLKTLSRGYSITLKHNDNKILTNTTPLKLGDQIETLLDSGKVVSTISKIDHS